MNALAEPVAHNFLSQLSSPRPNPNVSVPQALPVKAPHRQCHPAGVRLLDETAILACAAYVDLNPIRAAAETIGNSYHANLNQKLPEFLCSDPKPPVLAK